MATIPIDAEYFKSIVKKVQAELPAAVEEMEGHALAAKLASMATDLYYLQSCVKLGVADPKKVQPVVKAHWKKSSSVSWMFWVAVDFENMSAEQGTQDRKAATDISSKLQDWRLKKAACDKIVTAAAISTISTPAPPGPSRQQSTNETPAPPAAPKRGTTGSQETPTAPYAPGQASAARPRPPPNVQASASVSQAVSGGVTAAGPLGQPPVVAPAVTHAPHMRPPTVRPTVGLITGAPMRTSPHGRPVSLHPPSPLTTAWTPEETSSKRKDIDEPAALPPTPGGGKRIRLDPSVADITAVGTPSVETSAGQTAPVVGQPTTPASSTAPSPKSRVEVVILSYPGCTFKDGSLVYDKPCSGCQKRRVPCIKAEKSPRCERCVESRETCDYAHDRKRAGQLGSQNRKQETGQSAAEGSQASTSLKDDGGTGEQPKRKKKKDQTGSGDDDDEFRPSDPKKNKKGTSATRKVTIRALQEQVTQLQGRIDSLEEQAVYNNTIIGKALQATRMLRSEVGNALLGLGHDVAYALALADEAVGPNVTVDRPQTFKAYRLEQLSHIPEPELEIDNHMMVFGDRYPKDPTYMNPCLASVDEDRVVTWGHAVPHLYKVGPADGIPIAQGPLTNNAAALRMPKGPVPRFRFGPKAINPSAPNTPLQPDKSHLPSSAKGANRTSKEDVMDWTAGQAEQPAALSPDAMEVEDTVEGSTVDPSLINAPARAVLAAHSPKMQGTHPELDATAPAGTTDILQQAASLSKKVLPSRENEVELSAGSVDVPIASTLLLGSSYLPSLASTSSLTPDMPSPLALAVKFGDVDESPAAEDPPTSEKHNMGVDKQDSPLTELESLSGLEEGRPAGRRGRGNRRRGLTGQAGIRSSPRFQAAASSSQAHGLPRRSCRLAK